MFKSIQPFPQPCVPHDAVPGCHGDLGQWGLGAEGQQGLQWQQGPRAGPAGCMHREGRTALPLGRSCTARTLFPSFSSPRRSSPPSPAASLPRPPQPARAACGCWQCRRSAPSALRAGGRPGGGKWRQRPAASPPAAAGKPGGGAPLHLEEGSRAGSICARGVCKVWRQARLQGSAGIGQQPSFCCRDFLLPLYALIPPYPRVHRTAPLASQPPTLVQPLPLPHASDPSLQSAFQKSPKVPTVEQLVLGGAHAEC